MGNVVVLRRQQGELKEKVVEDITSDTNTLQLYFSFPEEDEGKVFFYTNFEPGAREVYAVEVLLSHLQSVAFPIVEDDS